MFPTSLRGGGDSPPGAGAFGPGPRRPQPVEKPPGAGAAAPGGFDRIWRHARQIRKKPCVARVSLHRSPGRAVGARELMNTSKKWRKPLFRQPVGRRGRRPRRPGALRAPAAPPAPPGARSPTGRAQPSPSPKAADLLLEPLQKPGGLGAVQLGMVELEGYGQLCFQPGFPVFAPDQEGVVVDARV